jgi:hypothetical protein
MRLRSSVVKRMVSVIALAWGIGVGSDAAFAQTTPTVVLLDPTAFDFGPSPHLIPSEVANELIGNVGLRDRIPYFATRVGDTVTLPSGDGMGNDGWFAVRSVPGSWESEPGAADGLQNFWLAGPGLGSPDEDGNRISMLDNVGDVVPLRAAGLGALTGRTVCAVVYDHDLIVAPGTPAHASLGGSNLGVAAFQVVSIEASDGDWPAVTVQILNAKETCGDALAPLAEAPDPFAVP